MIMNTVSMKVMNTIQNLMMIVMSCPLIKRKNEDLNDCKNHHTFTRMSQHHMMTMMTLIKMIMEIILTTMNVTIVMTVVN